MAEVFDELLVSLQQSKGRASLRAPHAYRRSRVVSNPPGGLPHGGGRLTLRQGGAAGGPSISRREALGRDAERPTDDEADRSLAHLLSSPRGTSLAPALADDAMTNLGTKESLRGANVTMPSSVVAIGDIPVCFSDCADDAVLVCLCPQ